MSIFTSDIVTSAISNSTTEGGFVDIFVYDTSKDSDGGAWRKRTQHTSWYNEAAAAGVRGSRKEFPSVAVIAVTTANLFIYDGDDPELPLWMRFNQTASGLGAMIGYSSFTIGCVTMLNGILMVGLNATNQGNVAGLRLINFISEDYSWKGADAGRNSSQYWPIVNRNGGKNLGYNDEQYILDEVVLDVAAKVLPGARINPDTKLPVPTIAVATVNGVSVIDPDGIVYNKTLTDDPTDTPHVAWTEDGYLLIPRDNYNYFAISTPYGEESTQHPSGFVNVLKVVRSSGTAPGAIGPNGVQGYGYANKVIGLSGADVAQADTNGMTIFRMKRDGDLGGDSAAYIASSYNTGHLVGTMRRAYLSDTDTTTKTNGQSEADRIGTNNGTSLTVVGNITKSAVMSGADLVAYSGWSSSNYLQNAHDTELAPGNGTYSVMCWVKTTSSASSDQYVFDRGTAFGTGSRNLMLITPANSGSPNGVQWWHRDASGNTSQFIATDLDVTDNDWHLLTGVQDGVGYKFYVDGVQSSFTNNVIRDVQNDNNPPLYIGIRHTLVSPILGSMALFRYSMTCPSPEKIKQIYEDEKHLFYVGAQATIYGSSDDVKAIAYDDTTDTVHVGTSSGRSEFRGLVRINNTTTAVTTAISASNGFVAEQ